jgi:hypothetical protein
VDRLDVLREEIQRDPRRALDGTTTIVSAARAEGDSGC